MKSTSGCIGPIGPDSWRACVFYETEWVQEFRLHKHKVKTDVTPSLFLIQSLTLLDFLTSFIYLLHLSLCVVCMSMLCMEVLGWCLESSLMITLYLIHWGVVLTWTQSSFMQIVIKLSLGSHLCLLCTGITQGPYTYLAFTWVLGIHTGSYVYISNTYATQASSSFSMSNFWMKYTCSCT